MGQAEASAQELEEAADDAREAAGLARKRQKAEDADAEPTYRRWSTSTWNKLETEEQNRRAIKVPREGSQEGQAASGRHDTWVA